MFPSSVVFGYNFDVDSLLAPPDLALYKTRAEALKKFHPWSENLLPVWQGYLVHLSTTVPGKIAYYASLENLQKGRITRTSPEMFLIRTLKDAPPDIQGAWQYEVLGKTLPELHFASNTEPERWERVYDEGPHSCMAGSSLVRFYCNPDNNLALAYITNEYGTPTHRTIVNQAKKTYLRVYGEWKSNPGFLAALQKAGYKHNGATLEDEVIEFELAECGHCGREFLVGPYLDGEFDHVQQVSASYAKIGHRGDTLYYGDPYDYECTCGEDHDEDD